MARFSERPTSFHSDNRNAGRKSSHPLCCPHRVQPSERHRAPGFLGLSELESTPLSHHGWGSPCGFLPEDPNSCPETGKAREAGEEKQERLEFLSLKPPIGSGYTQRIKQLVLRERSVPSKIIRIAITEKHRERILPKKTHRGHGALLPPIRGLRPRLCGARSGSPLAPARRSVSSRSSWCRELQFSRSLLRGGG